MSARKGGWGKSFARLTLQRKDAVVIGLAPAVSLRAPLHARVEDDIVGANLVIPQVVFAAAKHHKVVKIPNVLARVVVV